MAASWKNFDRDSLRESDFRFSLFRLKLLSFCKEGVDGVDRISRWLVVLIFVAIEGRFEKSNGLKQTNLSYLWREKIII